MTALRAFCLPARDLHNARTLELAQGTSDASPRRQNRPLSASDEEMASSCSGVIIGDVADRPLIDIFGRDDWRRNDILRTLADRVPIGLLGMAPGFEPKETYAQMCGMCWGIRSHLVETAPDTLAPAECYSAG